MGKYKSIIDLSLMTGMIVIIVVEHPMPITEFSAIKMRRPASKMIASLSAFIIPPNIIIGVASLGEITINQHKSTIITFHTITSSYLGGKLPSSSIKVGKFGN